MLKLHPLLKLIVICSASAWIFALIGHLMKQDTLKMGSLLAANFLTGTLLVSVIYKFWQLIPDDLKRIVILYGMLTIGAAISSQGFFGYEMKLLYKASYISGGVLVILAAFLIYRSSVNNDDNQ